MGTDIHMVTEKRIVGGWLGVNGFPNLIMTNRSSDRSVAVARNYALFSALASVRGDGPPPRGVPPDASALTRLMLREWPDGHGGSWLGLEEAGPIFVTHATPMFAYPGLLREDTLTDYATYLFGAEEAQYATLSEWRIVFWCNKTNVTVLAFDHSPKISLGK